MNVAWYVNRLRRMSAQEIGWRLRDEAVKRRWRVQKGKPATPNYVGRPKFSFIPLDAAKLDLDPAAAAAVIEAAEQVLAGRIKLFERDMPLPVSPRDWFVDPDSGREAPSHAYTFDVDARDPAVVGNLTFTPSRLIHVTLLASAYLVSGRSAFAELAASQLKSWWQANPFLTGIHYAAGIELGLRLVAFAWTRRLLAAWPGVSELFEKSELARDQIYRHQQYLGSLRSYGSSANNHLMAEYLGLYVGGTAFPWFAESERWAERGREGLEEEARRQVFADGFGRELASEYHGFTMELLMVAAAEGLLAGRPFSAELHGTIARMADAWAASLDAGGRPPRQGDTDDAYALLLDPPGRLRRAGGLLAEAGALIEPRAWWPAAPRDLGSAVFKSVVKRSAPVARVQGRAEKRPNLFPDAGIAFLRDLETRPDELWCRCDHGPHGYLAIAGHAHADALSVELRHGGVDLLVDPGTYCYLTDPELRRYVRSTIAHNTLEIAGRDQATYGGSFLWLDAPKAEAVTLEGLDDGPVARWVARHDGYKKLSGAPIHERGLTLDRTARTVEFTDRILGTGEFPVRLAFHLGPEVEVKPEGRILALRWQANGRAYTGRFVLPDTLDWQDYRGSKDPVMGWYSAAFHELMPSTSWIGSGTLKADTALLTRLEIDS